MGHVRLVNCIKFMECGASVREGSGGSRMGLCDVGLEDAVEGALAGVCHALLLPA